MSPRYRYKCGRCWGEWEVHQPFDDEPLKYHAECGGLASRILGPVRTYGLGAHGSHTARTDAKEAAWDADMPAYKRLRHNGEQPPGIDGCARLEATAENSFEVSTGGRFRFPEERVKEGIALAKEAGWSPVTQKREGK